MYYLNNSVKYVSEPLVFLGDLGISCYDSSRNTPNQNSVMEAVEQSIRCRTLEHSSIAAHPSYGTRLSDEGKILIFRPSDVRRQSRDLISWHKVHFDILVLRQALKLPHRCEGSRDYVIGEKAMQARSKVIHPCYLVQSKNYYLKHSWAYVPFDFASLDQFVADRNLPEV